MTIRDSILRLPLVSPATQDDTAAEIEQVVVQLFDQTQARLACYVSTFGVPSHDAEDIVQETFLSLFHHLRQGRPRWNLNGWLFRVAHNLALKRSHAARTAAVHPDPEPLLAQHPDPVENAEEQLAFDQIQRRLRSVLAALPELDRRCLHMRAEGLTYREISRALGVSLGSVSNSVARSLARMERATGGSGR